MPEFLEAGDTVLAKTLAATGAARLAFNYTRSPWLSGNALLALSPGAAVLTGLNKPALNDVTRCFRLQSESATDNTGGSPTRKRFAVPTAVLARLAIPNTLPATAAVTTGAAYVNCIIALVPRGSDLSNATFRERIAYGGTLAAGQWMVQDNAGTADGIAFYEDVPLGTDIIVIVPVSTDIVSISAGLTAGTPKQIAAYDFIAATTAAATLTVAPRGN